MGITSMHTFGKYDNLIQQSQEIMDKLSKVYLFLWELRGDVFGAVKCCTGLARGHAERLNYLCPDLLPSEKSVISLAIYSQSPRNR